MDKQYNLTDRVSKGSIKSPIFKKWVKRVLCIACILSLVLQLTLCCLPLQVNAAENDSIVGTWVFNDSINAPSQLFEINLNFNTFIVYSGVEYASFSKIAYSKFSTLRISNDTVRNAIIYDVSTKQVSNAWDMVITINDDPIDDGTQKFLSQFKSWLKANASKVVEEVYDFTGETRIFNDELTLFNTTDASFTYSSNFNFEVLGVGTADYIILQRTIQNNYTMSYSFDFEDSGGLTMIYRDSPPFNNDEGEWLGGKVNRKVITFHTNPEDPEFQQWLLDNTTLFDNVNDAYELGQQSGYNNGYEEGFANSLIGDSLSGPINALSQITLIEIQGTAITLGGVVMTAIALCLVLAFLKLYAGG